MRFVDCLFWCLTGAFPQPTCVIFPLMEHISQIVSRVMPKESSSVEPSKALDLGIQQPPHDFRYTLSSCLFEVAGKLFWEAGRHDRVIGDRVGVMAREMAGIHISLLGFHCRQMEPHRLNNARTTKQMSQSTFHKRLTMALAADRREQKDIAKAMGVSPAQVTRWKSKVLPNPDIVAKFVEALDIDGHWLITGQGSMKSGDRSDLAQRLDVVVDVASGQVSPDQLTALQVGVGYDKGQSDQLALQETLATAKQANASLSDIERRLAAIERFELTPMSELTDEETIAARKLAERAKTAKFGEEAQALGEGTKGG